MNDIVIETGRLRLRRHRSGDADLIELHANSPAVMKELGGPRDRTAIEAMIARNDACHAAHGHSFWVIERRADGVFLGLCGLRRVDTVSAPDSIKGEFEIGWRLREDMWGQGYAREAATAALERAFVHHQARRVIAFTSDSNGPSWGLMERLGMARRAEFDFDDPDYPPHLNPTIVYIMERDAWTA